MSKWQLTASGTYSEYIEDFSFFKDIVFFKLSSRVKFSKRCV